MTTHRARGLFRILTASCLGWPTVLHALAADGFTVSSPDGRLCFQLEISNGRASYRINAGHEAVIEPSPLGLTRSDADFTTGLQFASSSETRPVEETYTLHGSKEREVSRRANERVFRLRNGVGMTITLTVRAFDDGIGFRYGFPGQGSQVLQWTGEATGFNLPDEGRVWTQPYQKVDVWAPGYEAEYVNGAPIGTSAGVPEGWAMPLLAATKGRWTMLAESNVGPDAFAIHLQPEAPGGLYLARLPEAPETYGVAPQAASITLPWESPWRVIITGKSPGDIVESTLITDLASPSKVEDTSWIRPGLATWSWWSDHPSPGNFDKLMPFIDAAAELGWPYSLVDLGWHQMQGGDIAELARKAAERRVGLLVWYNSAGKHNEVPDAGPRHLVNDPLVRDAEFARIAAMGIKGIKVDFMQSDKQFVIGLYHDILGAAAKHKLLVNFHGATAPKGWERTWPHLLTMEAVRGGEQYWEQAFAEKAHTLNTIYAFTRNAVGPMDYTPTVFNRPVETNAKMVQNQTTHAHELALLVVFQSGIQHVIEHATGLMAQPDYVKEFLNRMPAAWDETRVLAGEPGRLAIIARRSGNTWYVGGINGTDNPTKEHLDLGFLTGGKRTISLITDSSERRTSLHRKIVSKPDEKLPVNLSPRGGFAAKITIPSPTP